jgi:chromosome segregation ATPase
MPTTPKLPLKLHEKLGDEAMIELLTMFTDLGAETRAEFEALRAADARLEARMDAGFADVRQEIADVRADLKQQTADLKQQTADLKQQTADLKQQTADLKQQIADLKPQIVALQSELIKWTFLFWLGTIGIVLLMLRFPP